MKIFTNETYIEQDVFELVHLFLQDSILDEQKPYVFINFSLNNCMLTLDIKIEFDDGVICQQKEITLKPYHDDLEKRRYCKREVKKFLYVILSEYFKKTLPWGCLTGIRPTKLGHELVEEGEDKYLLKEALMNNFYVSPNKARLVEKIVKNQTCIIKNDNLIDLYINIPFCPSKCSYCSFISAEYSAVEKIIPDYLEALIKEIRATKQIIRDRAYIVKNIYIGGGTPTVLSAQQLDLILQELSFGVNEFTVECGRPDTITKEKLDVLQKHGVTRISINPQTFVDATLKRIGRKHTSKDVIDAYMLALNYDFSINMDLIAGLPGESLRSFKKSISTVLEMYPDNITIHTLALKKGSTLVLQSAKNENDITEQMVEYGQNELIKNGYKPYYMYKLKNQNGGLENVGFFRDKMCMFNIDSMEEVATILACGANAISKRIYTSENRIERQANVKFASDYIARIDEMIQKKQQLFS